METIMSTTALLEEQIIAKTGFKHVLVATDFSSASRPALEYALLIARRYKSEIGLVHALPPTPIDAIPLEPLPGEMSLEQLKAEEEIYTLLHEAGFGEIPQDAHAVFGDAATVIAGVAEREQADLLVMGTHGRGVFKQMMLGSVAEDVLRQVRCPVLTVGWSVPLPPSNDFDPRSILFATDFGPACKSAAALAISLATDSQARLALLHMVPTPSAAELGYGYAPGAAEDLVACEQRTKAESLERLKDLVPENSGLAVSPEFLVDASFLPDGILDAAAVCRADLIVMGAHHTRNPRLASHMPWTVVHEVLCRARCPVLTVNC